MTVPARHGPTVVVAAVPLKRRAREHLAGQLGDGFVLHDIRDAGDTADVVLCPPCSPQAVGRLRDAFPDARLVVIELQDLEHGIDIRGPVGRILDGGASAYYLAPSAAALGQFLAALDARDRATSEHQPVDGEPSRVGESDAGALPVGTSLDDAIIRHVDEVVARRAARQS